MNMINRHHIITILLLIVLCNPAAAQEWSCYDPKPGHPTASERAAFISEVSPLAIDAEKKHGVPASAIAAMAIIESGYGFTRISLEANNLFGWKFVSTDGAGGREAYTLACQPPEDVNNRYIKFRDRADAVDFVAWRLKNSQHYAADSQLYRESRIRGVDAATSVRSWLAGIANPYNWRPAEYVRNVTRIMNNPLAPSDTVSSSTNLYRLSQSVVSPGPQVSPEKLALIRFAELKVSPWKSARCDAPVLNFPRWEGFPVTLCDYTDIGVTVRTYMLNADRTKIARWLVSACEEANVRDPKLCINSLNAEIMNASSGGIFPVAGYIPEPLGGNICYYFRDGVTVWTASKQFWQKPVNGQCGSLDENNEPLSKAWAYARIISTDRAEYKSARLAGDVEGVNFVDRVREAYQRAWSSDRNELISAKAKSMKAKGIF